MDYGSDVFTTVGEHSHIDFAAMNKGVTPIFFVEPEMDEVESEKQGRAVFREMERCRIQIAGDSFSAPVHPVDDYIRNRFFEQYNNWKVRKTSRTINGTPLKEWPLATTVQIKELEMISVFTVEDLASISDVHVSRIPDGRVWRQRAEAWLKLAADTAVTTRYAAENERLRARLDELESKIMAMRGSPEMAMAKDQARSDKMKAAWVRRKAKAAETAA